MRNQYNVISGVVLCCRCWPSIVFFVVRLVVSVFICICEYIQFAFVLYVFYSIHRVTLRSLNECRLWSLLSSQCHTTQWIFHQSSQLAVASKSMSTHVIAWTVLFSWIVMRYIRKCLGTISCAIVEVVIDWLVLIKLTVSINSRMASMQFLAVYKICVHAYLQWSFYFLHIDERRHLPQCFGASEKECLQLFLIEQKTIK